MTIEDLKTGDYFVMQKSAGRRNAVVYKITGQPYFNVYESCMVVPIFCMRKGTSGIKWTSLHVIKVNDWQNPFPIK